MLTLTYTPNAYQLANNLIPIGNSATDVRYESRPGFFQVVSDNVSRAIGWNDACMLEIYGGVYVWHGSIFEQINNSLGVPVDGNLRFTGTRFQGLQSLGNREEQLYIGNGSTIYYIHRNVIAGASVESVELKPETLDLIPNQTDSLSAVITPSWAINKKVSWHSDNPSIVSVDDEGVVTAQALGSATITVTTEDGNHTDSSLMTVIPYVAVTGISLTEDSITLEVNDSIDVIYEVQPDNAISPEVYWLSDNPKIATISSWGELFALSEGETSVEVRTKEGHFSDRCTVTVVQPETTTQQIVSKRSQLTRNIPQINEDRFYEAVVFDNEFLDAEGAPYTLPKAKFMATWRNRLWAGDGTHIIYHCLNDNPQHWEPLDAIAIQGGEQSEVTGLCAMGNRLIVSTISSLWQIVGDSPYNWEYQQVVHGHGAMNDRSLATDGSRLFYLDRWGVYELGKPTPISKPIEKLFFTPDYGGELVLENRGEYLYLLLNGRCLVYHTLSEQWGEIIPPFESSYAMKGLVIVGGQIGFYGDNGLWLCGNQYGPDSWMNQNRQPVISTVRSWPVQPNKTGMTALNRMYLEIEGIYGTEVSYRVYPDSRSDALATHTFNGWHYLPESLEIQQQPLEVLFREQPQLVNQELSLAVSSKQFEHELQASGYMRLHSISPRYQFTER